MQKQEELTARETQPSEIGAEVSSGQHENRSRCSGDLLVPQHALDIETRPIASLTLRPRNPRTHLPSPSPGHRADGRARRWRRGTISD